MPASEWRYEKPMNGWGTGALVCALVALVVGVVPVVGDLVALPLSVVAVGCGLRGVARVEDGLATNPRTAWAGVFLGSVAGLLSFLTLVVVFAA